MKENETYYLDIQNTDSKAFLLTDGRYHISDGVDGIILTNTEAIAFAKLILEEEE